MVGCALSAVFHDAVENAHDVGFQNLAHVATSPPRSEAGPQNARCLMRSLCPVVPLTVQAHKCINCFSEPRSVSGFRLFALRVRSVRDAVESIVG